MRNTKASMPCILLICLCLVANVLALEQYTVGVHGGDSMKYSVNGTVGGQSVQGAWMEIDIQSVSGTVIYGTVAGNAPGYSTTSQEFSIDIETGNYTGVDLFFWFIPANLNAGDTPPALGVALEGPTTRYNRQALYITYSYSGTSIECYLDQATGVLLELTLSATGTSETVQVTEARVGGVVIASGGGAGGFLGLEWWLWIVIIVIIVAVIVAVVLLLRKRRRPAAPAPTPQIPLEQPPPPPELTQLRIQAEPTEIIADGESATTLTVQLVDNLGRPLAALSDTEVRISATRGTVENPVLAIPRGKDAEKTVITSSKESGPVTVLVEGPSVKSTSITINFVEKKRFCMHCGVLISFRATRCPKCGRTPPAGLDTKVCKNCKSVIPVVAKFCSECGAGQPE